jgi:hypothetical protein
MTRHGTGSDGASILLKRVDSEANPRTGHDHGKGRAAQAHGGQDHRHCVQQAAAREKGR